MTVRHFTPEQVNELTNIVENAVAGVVAEAVAKAVREELRNAGLRVDGQSNQEASTADFQFLRKFRTAFDGTASKVGGAIILALVSGFIWLLWAGFQTILSSK